MLGLKLNHDSETGKQQADFTGYEIKPISYSVLRVNNFVVMTKHHLKWPKTSSGSSLIDISRIYLNIGCYLNNRTITTPLFYALIWLYSRMHSLHAHGNYSNKLIFIDSDQCCATGVISKEAYIKLFCVCFAFMQSISAFSAVNCNY